MIVQAGVGIRLVDQRPGLEWRLGIVEERGGDLGLHDLARCHLHGDAEVRHGRGRAGRRAGAGPRDEGGQRGQRDGRGGQRHRHRHPGVQSEAATEWNVSKVGVMMSWISRIQG